MKTVLCVILTCFYSFIALGQSKDKKKEVEIIEVLIDKEGNGNYKCDSIFQVSNITKEEMYSRARKWVIANLKTNDNNVEFNEVELSITTTPTILIPSYNVSFSGEITRGLANFKLNLQFKDNRYRITVDNVSMHLEYGRPIRAPRVSSYNDFMATDGKKAKEGGGKPRYALDIYTIKEINKQIEALNLALYEAITNEKGKNDDW